MADTIYGSTAITIVGYDEDSEELTVQFTDGSRYAYDDVSGADYRGLMGAASVGAYFNAHIRNEHSYRRI